MTDRRSHTETPIVSRVTPPGRGAIASLVVEGVGAKGLVAAIVSGKDRERFVNLPVGGVCAVQLHIPHHSGETVVLGNPDPNTVEIHCHGGTAAVTRIERALSKRGCRPIAWRDWIEQHESDPIAASARVLLASARTGKTAAVLFDQYAGALRRAIEHTMGLLQSNRTEAGTAVLEDLLMWLPLGLHLTKPWSVVLAGPVNAGKSSLINRLLGRERAIVHRRPGTTRDAVTEITALAGWPVELCDTAGLRQSSDPAEAAGVELATGRLRTADLVVLVFDVSQPWKPRHGKLLDCFPEALIVHNKCDLPADATVARPRGMTVSALRGHGIAELIDAIATRLLPREPKPGTAVPFTAEQGTRIGQALEAARNGQNSLAIASLQQVLS